MSFGKNVAFFRMIAAKKTNASAFAREMGVSAQYLNDVEKGAVEDPRMSTIRRFAKALDVSADALMCELDPEELYKDDIEHIRQAGGLPFWLYTPDTLAKARQAANPSNPENPANAIPGGRRHGESVYGRAVLQPPLSDNDQAVVNFFTEVSERCAESLATIRRRALGQHAAKAAGSQAGTRDPHPRPSQQTPKARGK